MTEPAPRAEVGGTAGALLRAAREQQGLHIAALAASIKVPPRKLEALEADRLDELHDAAFVRALAQAVCRALKMDPREVLARLPSGAQPLLERMEGGLNAPFRERAMPASAGLDLAQWLRHPALAVSALLLLAAAAVWFWPSAGIGSLSAAWPTMGGASASTVSESVAEPSPLPPADAGGSAPEASTAAPVPAGAATLPLAAVVETVHSVPRAEAGASAAQPTIDPVVLVLRAREPSWVDVSDARGQSLLSRTLSAGETVGIDGSLPLKVRIGNAAGTEVAFRGQVVDLTPMTRENIARLELK